MLRGWLWLIVRFGGFSWAFGACFAAVEVAISTKNLRMVAVLCNKSGFPALICLSGRGDRCIAEDLSPLGTQKSHDNGLCPLTMLQERLTCWWGGLRIRAFLVLEGVLWAGLRCFSGRLRLGMGFT